jgi:hypothetical protein
LVLELTIPLLPCSVNRSKTRSRHGTIFTTAEYRQKKKEIMTHLIRFKSDMLVFAEMFDRRYHYIRIDWKMYRKRDVYYTKKGDLSLKAGDTDNYKKQFKDCIFEHLGINDALVKYEQIIQLPSNHDYMTAVLKIADAVELDPKPSLLA